MKALLNDTMSDSAKQVKKGRLETGLQGHSQGEQCVLCIGESTNCLPGQRLSSFQPLVLE
jgi:hypothetical protein